MKALHSTISAFVEAAINEKMLDSMDAIYITNRILSIFGENEMTQPEDVPMKTMLACVDDLVSHAISLNIIENTQSDREIFEAQILDLVTPYPSTVNAIFWNLYHENIQDATDYFYQLSKNNDYIKTRQIAKNIEFKYESPFGELDITINLSKPEKDPKEIQRARESVQSNYPLCALCMENEGYRGHMNHAARQNHRIIRMRLNDEIYGFQYSPYSYYNEHAIFLNEKHIPMIVDERCFSHLLGIVEQFPHYFVGSNADLPIVGGSILAHDHYQGGRYTFPMERATAYDNYQFNQYPTIQVDLVNWPLTVIRLKSQEIKDLVALSTTILAEWRQYSDASNDILAFTDETPHNTITPIARYRSGHYEMDLVLRNNRTSDEYPDGIFHPHKEKHHIKKENIGLIEVMGLAILPPRLVQELAEVKAFLLDTASIEQVQAVHQDWARELKEKYPTVSTEAVDRIIEEEVGIKFSDILEDAGVYKQTEQGRHGLRNFLEHVNTKIKGA